MVAVIPAYDSAWLTKEPERHMAALLTRSLGHEVSPEQVVDLFRLHWVKLSIMAHAIHDQQTVKEPTNGR